MSDPEVLAFCKALNTQEIQKLAFQKQKFSGIENRQLVAQAISYQAAKEKLPGWWNSAQVVFPDKIAVEQSTSEWVARWKSTLIHSNCPLFLDASAGLGVDSYFLGKNTGQQLLFETQTERADLLAENLQRLGLSKCQIFNHSLIQHLEENPDLLHSEAFLYVDPDRRPPGSDRKWNWNETEPNILSLAAFAQKAGCHFLTKLSPMDNAGDLVQQIPGAEAIFTISLHNEVKELLVYWNFSNPITESRNFVVEISKSGIYRQIELASGALEDFTFAVPETEKFLLDPWAAMRKGFQSINWMRLQGFGLISAETQLFLSDVEAEDFPGRVFQIVEIIGELNAFGKKNQKAGMHVVARDFPNSAEEIKKKFGWIETGNQFLFCYQNPHKENVYLLCKRQENKMKPENWMPLPQFNSI